MWVGIFVGVAVGIALLVGCAILQCRKYHLHHLELKDKKRQIVPLETPEETNRSQNTETPVAISNINSRMTKPKRTIAFNDSQIGNSSTAQLQIDTLN